MSTGHPRTMSSNVQSMSSVHSSVLFLSCSPRPLSFALRRFSRGCALDKRNILPLVIKNLQRFCGLRAACRSHVAKR
jgi:hypothetical protein